MCIRDSVGSEMCIRDSTYVRFVTHLGFNDEALQAFSERISE
jgi:hypothetical protein